MFKVHSLTLKNMLKGFESFIFTEKVAFSSLLFTRLWVYYSPGEPFCKHLSGVLYFFCCFFAVFQIILGTVYFFFFLFDGGMIMLGIFCVLPLLFLLLPMTVSADEVVSTLEEQDSVAVTIYNQDLALIRDSRTVSLDTGLQTLAFREVSAKIRPETALLTAPNLQILEQNFEYDLLTPQALLEKYVGQKVLLVKTHPSTGEEVQQEAKVLSASNGVVLHVGDHIESGIPGRLIYPNVPDNLRDRPTLTLLVNNKTAEPQPVILSYLSGGLSWKADYVAELNADDTQWDLRGWVTLKNESGASYHNARLQLVAGEVNRVKEYMQPVMMMSRAVAEESEAGMSQESMFEYHLYTLARPTTIREKQSKQVALLEAEGVQVDKEFLLQGSGYYYGNQAGNLGQKLKVGVFLDMNNTKEAGAGQPLPAGVIRVYKKDSGGMLQFVGEDRIDHTPENETVRLKLGDAFDLTASKTQMDFKKLPWNNNHLYESSYQVELKNAKDETVSIRVLEPIPGDWEITEESLPHTKESSNTASWQVEVPPKSSSILTWRVRVRY
jgi:hypothetical protein